MPIVSPEAISDPKLAWFRKARFGMFIHFGLYALLERGEWVQYHENIPREEYEQLMERFNPERFDAEAWVTLAEEAGCKYITFTTKHHDGFCLFDSEHTDFKITNTPFGRDLTRELIDACHAHEMPIVLYYSQPDWHHPNFVHLPGAFKDLQNPPEDQEPSWAEYREYFHAQVMELCNHYGQIDGIWFDGSHKSEQTWGGDSMRRLIRLRQSSAVVNDRARRGDFLTPERTMPEDLTGYMFEVCESICTTHWGYARDAPQYNAPSLIDKLVRVVSRGGNFLLNVGPKPDGTIPEYQAARMRAVGDWLKTYGDAVYDTEAGRLETGSPDMVTTRKGNAVYLSLCKWPDTDRILIPGIRTEPESTQLVVDDKDLETRFSEDGVEIVGLPLLPPDSSVNVIRLQFDGVPELTIEEPVIPEPETIALREHLRTVLPVCKATPEGLGVKGTRLRVTERVSPETGTVLIPGQVVANWSALEQRLVWKIDSPKALGYRVDIWLACPKPYDQSDLIVESKMGVTSGKVKSTRSFDDYVWQSAGTVYVPQGKSRLVLRPLRMPYGYIFAHVAAIRLEPTK